MRQIDSIFVSDGYLPIILDYYNTTMNVLFLFNLLFFIQYPILFVVCLYTLTDLTLPVCSGQYRSPILGIAEGTVHIGIRSRSMFVARVLVVLTIASYTIP